MPPKFNPKAGSFTPGTGTSDTPEATGTDSPVSQKSTKNVPARIDTQIGTWKPETSMRTPQQIIDDTRERNDFERPSREQYWENESKEEWIKWQFYTPAEKKNGQFRSSSRKSPEVTATQESLQLGKGAPGTYNTGPIKGRESTYTTPRHLMTKPQSEVPDKSLIDSSGSQKLSYEDLPDEYLTRYQEIMGTDPVEMRDRIRPDFMDEFLAQFMKIMDNDAEWGRAIDPSSHYTLEEERRSARAKSSLVFLHTEKRIGLIPERKSVLNLAEPQESNASSQAIWKPNYSDSSVQAGPLYTSSSVQIDMKPKYSDSSVQADLKLRYRDAFVQEKPTYVDSSVQAELKPKYENASVQAVPSYRDAAVQADTGVKPKYNDASTQANLEITKAYSKPEIRSASTNEGLTLDFARDHHDPGDIDTANDIESLQQYSEGGLCPIDIGETLIRRYEVVHKLGHGSTATVWLCYDNMQNDWVAVKITAARYSTISPDAMMIQWARASGVQSKLEPNHIVRSKNLFYKNSPNGKHICIVYPLLGTGLPEWRSGLGNEKKDVKKITSVCYQFTKALGFLHEHNICHGDFRPQNILLKLDSRRINALSRDDMKALVGEPQTIRVTTKNGRRSRNAPKTVVNPIRSNCFGEFALDEVVLIDFSNAFTLWDPPGNLAHLPRQYAGPEVMFNYRVGVGSDIWALAWTLSEVRLGLKYSSDLLPVIERMEMNLGPMPFPYRDIAENLMIDLEVPGAPARVTRIPGKPRFEQTGLNAITGVPKASAIKFLSESEEANDTTARVIDPPPKDVIELGEVVGQMLKYDPLKRTPVKEALKHKWFKRQTRGSGTWVMTGLRAIGNLTILLVMTVLFLSLAILAYYGAREGIGALQENARRSVSIFGSLSPPSSLCCHTIFLINAANSSF
ncbi:kinase-like domain-containing protein [Xylariaceae sp. FL0016]|nr:kinase-like domain-containing protein [Xylariaceae sp. FL0016]